MALSKDIDDEIKRKAALGISLTNPTAEKQALYDQYTKLNTPSVTASPTSSNKNISDTDLYEIQRKASLGIPLTDYTAQKQEIYNSYKNPTPSYINYEAAPAPSYIGYTANPMPQYDSKYQSQIDAVLDSLINAPAFSYDHKTDPLYSQYKESYNREGDRAMTNAMAEASTLTGGRANSWAMTAGQQAQNYYNSQLNDKIPELQQLAYEMHMQDLNNKRSNIGTLQSLEDMMYGQFRGTMSDYFNNRDFEYGQTQDQNSWNWNTYVNNRDFEAGQVDKENNWNWNDYTFNKNYDRGVIDSDRAYDYNLWNAQNALAIDQRDFDNDNYWKNINQSNWQQGFDRGNYEFDASRSDSNYWKGIGQSNIDREYNLGLQDRIDSNSKWEREHAMDLANQRQNALKNQSSSSQNTGLSYSKYYDEFSKMINNSLDKETGKQEAKRHIFDLIRQGILTEAEGERLSADLRLY